MNILITGAGGSVGAAMTRYFSEQHRVLALAHDSLDITDPLAVRRTLFTERPDLIINCAVLGVDSCERDPSLARQINADGPRYLAEAAALVDAEMVHFSSNYVFDGHLPDHVYTIEDVPSPINEYGRTKLEGELAVSAALARSYIVRTSWVFGGSKYNFLSEVPEKLISGQKIKAITEVSASPTCIADLVWRVGEVLIQKRHGTYHVVNGGVCSYFEFAREAARILGLSEAENAMLIEPVSEDAVKQNAERPRHTPMRCLVSEELGLTPMRDWRQALLDVIRSGVVPLRK